MFLRKAAVDLVKGPLPGRQDGLATILLHADRFALAKRRWRGKAEDNREFGFDLEKPLRHGDAFFQTELATYVIAQKAEAVVKVALSDAQAAARVAWTIGNMHFPIALENNTLIAEDNPTVRFLLERDKIPYTTGEGIFQPFGGASGHQHSL